MTDDVEFHETIAAARREDEDPALLQGAKARWAMFFIACILSTAPMLYFIPHFADWRGVVGYAAAILVTLCGPLMALLIPRKDQEQYRQALIESEARRKALKEDLEHSQQMALGFGRREPGP